jgi:hypothetical protein
MSTINNATPFQAGPFPNNDILQYCMQFVKPTEIASCAQVCKSWETTMQLSSLWWHLFDQEKIPHVEGHDQTTAMQDFKLIYPMTYSKKNMACLGEFIGSVPNLSQEVFDTLMTGMDPYEPEKKMSKTFVVVVEPTHILRLFHQALFDDLVKNGDFDVKTAAIDSLKENGLIIPYSVKNLKILGEHPLNKKGNGLVFNSNSLAILDQYNTIAKTVNLSIMRLEVPKESLNLPYLKQKELLKKYGQAMAPLCTRLYFDLGEVLTKGTCPDKKAEPLSSYTWTSDELQTDASHSLILGGFSPDSGLDFMLDEINSTVHPSLGSVPYLNAKVVLQGSP